MADKSFRASWSSVSGADSIVINWIHNNAIRVSDTLASNAVSHDVSLTNVANGDLVKYTVQAQNAAGTTMAVESPITTVAGLQHPPSTPTGLTAPQMLLP